MPAPSDLVYQQSATPGTGNLTLAAINGRRTFAAAFGTGVTTNVFDYFITAASGSGADEWEIGKGHMSNSTTMVRDTVVSSSNSNAPVSLSGGIVDVTNDIPAANQLIGIRRFTPVMYGAVGDGVTDDSAAFNAMFNAVRTSLATTNDFTAKFEVDLNGTYACGNINVTGINCINLTILGGRIKGIVSGKPIFDMCGTRGVTLRGTTFIGDKTNMPTCAYQQARTASIAFCDYCNFDDICTLGYYSRAAIHIYGQETCTHTHCKYWNYNPAARVAILEGYDAHPFTSDYQTVITGGTSYINNKFVNCAFVYIPLDYQMLISGISKANPAVVTTSFPHPFVNGDIVAIGGVNGMTQVNNLIASVANATSTTFQLAGIDSTAYSTYTSGGLAVKQCAYPPIYLARAEGQRFDTCYGVSYGRSSMEIGFPDSAFLNLDAMNLDFLFEGYGILSHFKFTVGTNACAVTGLRIRCYNTNAYSSFFSTDASGGGGITISPADIEVTSHTANASLPLCDTYSKYSFLGGRINWPGSLTSAITLGQFTGTLAQSNGFDTLINPLFVDQGDAAYTPASVTPGSGSITTVGSKAGTSKTLGKIVHLTIQVTITTNGTGATNLTISLPFTASASGGPWHLFGRETVVSGKALIGTISNGGSTAVVFAADNTYPGGTGAQLNLSGWYVKA